ncbi:hypothetical protein WJX72_002942 [[Myrmecia] bisecta]|uniref:RING-type E3 ubiquitin transferase n=1 Tax=[Myrmecia] bisecta TaxID=41462 RepID=A0AAW1P3A5_9CHLO
MAELHISSVLRKVFAVTLDPSAGDPSASPPVLYLQSLHQELQSENQGQPAGQLFQKDNLERVLMSRLMEGAGVSYPQPPLQYLLGCYARALEEFRASSTLKDKAALEGLQQALQFGRELIVSYAGLLLTIEMFPQPAEAQQRGPLQLLDSLTQRESSGSVVAMPAGFLEELAIRFEGEGLEQILEPVARELARRLVGLSPLGGFQGPMQILQQLTGIKPLARTFTKLPAWLPRIQNGRSVQRESLLGPFFGLSVVPDMNYTPQPNVREQCFSNLQSRRPSDIQSALLSLRMLMGQVYDSLFSSVMNLLRGQETREDMLAWLAGAVESNMERGKMQINPLICASHGFFINLSAVLIRMCDPFVEPLAGKAWSKIDVRYVADNVRLDFMGETSLNADEEEKRAWLERVRSGAESGSSGGQRPSYHFICETFFLTAKGLHLGLMRTIDEHSELAKEQSRVQEYVRDMEAVLPRLAGTPQASVAEHQLQLAKSRVAALREELLCYQTVLTDEALLRGAMGYYRLVAAWLLRLASPAAAAGGPPEMPLPNPCPMHFRALPEYFVEDIADLLLHVGRAAPNVVDSTRMEELISFLVVGIGSPHALKNPYLRGKLVEVLTMWMPMEGVDGRAARMPLAASLMSLFEGHPLVQQHMVRSLLQLYVDIEHVDRSNAFFAKFTIRYQIGEILKYLWGVPAHRAVWKQVAQESGGRGLYLQFCNFLVNDSIYLLDESMKMLPEVGAIEKQMADPAAWGALSDAERTERERTLAQHGGQLRSLLALAAVSLRTMQFSTEEITAPWLLPEMVHRVAGMLNYFLKYLSGPERKNLKVKEPQKYNWRPKDFLTYIAQVYLHLNRADSDGVFARAIAADQRSYREEMFPATANVMRSFQLLPEDEISELEGISLRIAAASAEAVEEDELLGEIPDEFKDLLTDDLMHDPVTLPTSGSVLDRSTIARHLLSYDHDPFSRKPLRIEDCIPNLDLKARIDKWREQQKAARMNLSA